MKYHHRSVLEDALVICLREREKKRRELRGSIPRERPPVVNQGDVGRLVAERVRLKKLTKLIVKVVFDANEDDENG